MPRRNPVKAPEKTGVRKAEKSLRRITYGKQQSALRQCHLAWWRCGSANPVAGMAISKKCRFFERSASIWELIRNRNHEKCMN